MVIVNHRAGSLLGRALDGLEAHRDVLASVTVVDNASDDGSWRAAERDGVRLLRQPENLGFARAFDVALETTRAPYVLSLNADVDLSAGYVARLRDALRADPGLAAATGVLVLPSGWVDSTGIELTTANWALDRDRGGHPDAITTGEPFGVSGAAGLFRRRALDHVGPFWTALFVYWEDVEWAWRARRAGWRFTCVADARATHQRGADRADPGFVEAMAFRGRLASGLRHHRAWHPHVVAATALVTARLALRRPRALLDAHVSRQVWRAARREDRRRGLPRGPLPLVPHPWRPWLAAQLTGGRAGLGAVPAVPPTGGSPRSPRGDVSP